MAYQPRVDDYHIAKAVDFEGKRWVWRFEIDGGWRGCSGDG
jgi:hypothetical protein